MHKDIDDYEHIDEERIVQRAKETKSKSLNHLLKIAAEWREAGCTPVFIIAQDEPMIIACVSEETFGKLYN
jgi:hypothetical protein